MPGLSRSASAKSSGRLARCGWCVWPVTGSSGGDGYGCRIASGCRTTALRRTVGRVDGATQTDWDSMGRRRPARPASGGGSSTTITSTTLPLIDSANGEQVDEIETFLGLAGEYGTQGTSTFFQKRLLPPNDTSKPMTSYCKAYEGTATTYIRVGGMNQLASSVEYGVGSWEATSNLGSNSCCFRLAYMG